MSKTVMAVWVLFALWSAAVSADTPVEKSCDVESGCRVIIKNVAGLVQVQSWDQKRVELKGSLGEDVTRLDFTGAGSLVNIEVVVPRRHGNRIASSLSISVPAGTSLDIEAVSADVRVKEVAGQITASTVSGNLEIDKASAAVGATSVSGDVRVSAGGATVTAKTASGNVGIRGELASARADTVSGDVEIAGNAQRVAAETISGNITVAGEIQDLKAKTVSGDVSASRALSQADASTVSGNIKVEAGALVSADFSSESGDVRYSGDLATAGIVKAFSRSGNITVRTSENQSTEIEASTLSGDIRNAFGPAPEKRRGPGSTLRFGPVGVTGRLSLETMSGDIDLERK